jgi:small GTP-binding protein
MNRLPVLKVVVAGDGAVGKTSLIRRYCEGKFEIARVQTIGVDFQTQTVDLPQGTVKLSIWDMAGQDRFEVMRGGFYRGSRASALVFDVTLPETFESLLRWRKEILNAVQEQPFLVIGNKVDLERVIPHESAQAFAESIHAPYLETSALTGEGVPGLFEMLARRAVGQGK